MLPYNRIQEQHTGSRCIQNKRHFFQNINNNSKQPHSSNVDPTKQYFSPLYRIKTLFPHLMFLIFFSGLYVIFDTLSIDWSKEKIELPAPHHTVSTKAGDNLGQELG